MAKDRELEYILALKDEASAVWKKFSSGMEKGTGDLKGSVASLGTAVGAMFSLAAAKEFIDQANEAEMMVARLDQALKNNGVTSAETREQMLAYSESLMQVTTFDDDVITGLQATALTMTGNMKAVQPLTKASLDLASATGMSAEAAMKMFTKSVEGAEGLKKLGITIGETSSENERLEKTMAAVEKKFGGFAENEAKTGAGAMKQLGNAVGNLEEALGGILKDILIPILPALQAVLGLISKAVPVIISTLKMAFANLYDVILTPLAAIESALNFLGVTDSKVLQGLEKSAEGLAKKYKDEVIGAFQNTNKAVLECVITADRYVATNESLRDKLKRLKDELEKLDPTTVAYGRKLQQIIAIENEFKLATERAEHAIKGISGVTSDDTFFVTRFQKKLGELNTDIADTTNGALKELKKAFGGDVSEADSQAVADQAAISAEIQLKSFASEKEAELSIVDEWEAKAVDMANENEGLITNIRRIASDERAQIEINAAMKTFDTVAGLAQRGVAIIAKFTQQQHQSIINSLDKSKEKELKAIDAERQAAKDKYDELLANELLTAEQSADLKKQAEEEDRKIVARKTAAEEEYAKKIAAEKTKAFEAEKTAAMIGAVINTAVEVTKVLATPWMIPIVAALGAAEVALIASQPTPTFHEGGTMGFGGERIPLASDERPAIMRVGETVRTPEQERALQTSRGSVSVTVNINSPFTDTQAVRKAIVEGLKQTGLTADQFLTYQNGSVVLAQ
jgi:hypothetical protein